MKLKYYLRGLGIGIAVTAMIMGFSANGRTESLTDAQIISRAKELGMVDGGVLSQLPEKDSHETESTEEADDAVKDEAGSNETGKALPEEEEGIDGTESAEAPKETEGQEAEDPEVDVDRESMEAGSSGEEAVKGQETPEAPGTGGDEEEDVTIYTVSVYPGEGSYTVSRKVAALGLVESATLFDDFLCQNGYDKKLCTGNYRVREGASVEEIAKVLTGQAVN